MVNRHFRTSANSGGQPQQIRLGPPLGHPPLKPAPREQLAKGR
jgi:hypothetical protein